MAILLYLQYLYIVSRTFGNGHTSKTEKSILSVQPQSIFRYYIVMLFRAYVKQDVRCFQEKHA